MISAGKGGRTVCC